MEGKKVALKVMVTVMIVAMIVAVMPTQAVAYTYNRHSAVNYALKYAYSPNPDYKYFPNADCANFVSQCLHAGGWPEQGKYCCGSSSSWYYDWGRRPGYSNTWAVANDFGRFVSIYSGRGYARSLGHKPWNLYFKIGDIVQIDYPDENTGRPDGRWDHTMIITRITPSDMNMTYHSENRRDKSLTQIMSDNLSARFMGYNLKDGYLSADLNCDGSVNLADHAILMSFWGKDPSGANSCQSPDINQDGKVNLADQSIMMSQWTGKLKR
jgi:hypothetical protein